MEEMYIVRRDPENPDELCHYGIKGMRWGVRRYQNPDGSLTEAGLKRYSSEMSDVKKAKEKLAKEKQELKNHKETQAKIDKLERAKAKVKIEREAVKAETKRIKDAEKQKRKDAHKFEREEKERIAQEKQRKKQEREAATKEIMRQKEREKLLNESDPKKLYENRHLLTTEELNERMNRIVTEQRLASMVPQEIKKDGKYYINKLKDGYKTVDDIYGTLNNSNIGKALKKKFGKDDSEKKFDLEKFVKDIDKKSPAEVKEMADLIGNRNKVFDALDKDMSKLGKDVGKTVKDAFEYATEKESERLAKQEQKAAEKQAKKEQKAAERQEKREERAAEKEAKKESKKRESEESLSGTVVGEGTSKSDIKRGSSWVDDWDVESHTPVAASDVKRGQAYLDQLTYNEEEYLKRFKK